MSQTKEFNISELSSHIFWDTPLENIDPLVHSRFIVERVMSHGLINDWNTIKRWYGKEGLREIVTKIRVLDGVSLAFLCLILDLKKEDFRCYIEKQSQPHLWNY